MTSNLFVVSDFLSWAAVVYTTSGSYPTHHVVKNLDLLHHGMNNQVCLL